LTAGSVAAVMRRGALTVAATVLTLALSLSGCGRGSQAATTGGSGATSTAPQTATTEAPKVAGKNPSAISREVCANKAQSEIMRVLGVTARVTTPTWVDHLYSCHYGYPSGAFVLSVKELSSWSETLAYYHSLGQSLGDTGALGNLGQGAFTTSDGSVVVRKDWKVLVVDIAPLPAQFGKPPTSKSDVAYTVASIILGCWAGD
jgi:hypothetical protein